MDESRTEASSPSWGWMFVLPWHYAMGPEARWLTMLWMAGLLFPLAFWSARGLRALTDAASEIAFQSVIVVLGLCLVPRLANLPMVDWTEWLAAGVGLTAGWWLGTCSTASSSATA
jgi:hypothetical protein